MKNKLLKLLSYKPELVLEFPEWMFLSSEREKIKTYQEIALAEIAGRDSIAAIILACQERKFKAIVPTIAYTGTEYGNWEITFKALKILKNRLKSLRVKVFKPIFLGSPVLWWQLCGRYALELFKKYQFYSPCINCHLYLHTIRIPLAKKLGSKIIIGGERELHDGKIKINQIKEALDIYVNFLKKFNLELYLPLRLISSGKEIENIIGVSWDEGKEQMECVLSKNYLDSKGNPIIEKENIKKILEEFALKEAEKWVKTYLKKLKQCL